jgi:hypothetical protein
MFLYFERFQVILEMIKYFYETIFSFEFNILNANNYNKNSCIFIDSYLYKNKLIYSS